MEGMTDKQFEEYKTTLLKLVLAEIETCETLDEAKEKIKALLNE